jgi:hypothetical protein
MSFFLLEISCLRFIFGFFQEFLLHLGLKFVIWYELGYFFAN